MPNAPRTHKGGLTPRRFETRSRRMHDRVYNRRWRRVSKQFLRRNPFCAKCFESGAVVPSEVTDHIEPHDGDYAKFWDESNWRALCVPCHNRKTATEDGGFGNPRGK